jgi:hypothetical protein
MDVSQKVGNSMNRIAALAVTVVLSAASAQAAPKAAPPKAAPPGKINSQEIAAAPQPFVGKATGTEDGAVARRLRNALAESESRLGGLEPWQKKIFDDEALPQYQRFIRNYRSGQSHSGTAISAFEVDVDMDSLKSYLQFYAPKTLGRDEKNSNLVLLYLRAELSCEKCVAAGPGVRKLAQLRVERRGLMPVWLTADDLGVGSDGKELSGKALNERVSTLAHNRNAAAALVVQWGPAPADDVDTAHADEKHFLLQSWLQARGLAATGKLSAGAQNVAVSTGSVDLMEMDSFELAAGRLFSDAFVDMGAQALKAEQAIGAKALAGTPDNEVDVDVSGVRDFAQYSKLKAQIQAKLVGVGVEDRKLSRGRVTLALMGSKSPAETLRSQLVGLPLDPSSSVAGRLAALDTGPSPASDDVPAAISMEIRQ